VNGVILGLELLREKEEEVVKIRKKLKEAHDK
jgi:hypothetical protein